jgi:hypothetical protein
MALHVLLARLTPAERTAYVLHDVFRYSFDDIADIVGRTPAASRQLAARARQRIQADGDAARFTIESSEQRRVTDAFIAACSTGDLDGLLAVLDPDVAGQADIGGTIGLRPPIVGSIAVARGALQYLGPRSSTTLLSLPTGEEPTIIALRGNRVVTAVTLTVRADRITHDPGRHVTAGGARREYRVAVNRPPRSPLLPNRPRTRLARVLLADLGPSPESRLVWSGLGAYHCRQRPEGRMSLPGCCHTSRTGRLT